MFFSKPKGPQITDQVFLNENGFIHAIDKWMQQNYDGVVAVWFQHDLEQLEQKLPGATQHRFVLAERLGTSHYSESKPLLFAGHYPLRSAELLLSNEFGLKQMLFYSHMDMPLFQFFGGDRLKELMIKMGIDEDEPISHAMITKSLSHAQDKITEACPADMRALSEAEWMRINVKA